MEKKGYIEREIDKENRRNIIVNITDAGKKYTLDVLMENYNLLVKSFELMGEDDTKQLIALAKK